MFRNRSRITGMVFGLGVAALCTWLGFRLSAIQRLELQSLDFRFRRVSTLERDPRIVHVDIDDNALDRVGRWPWPRRDTADIIRALADLGADVIAVDLLFDDHQRPTFDDPKLSKNSDIEPHPPIRGEPSYNQIVYDDLELADAIRTAGNVFISMHMRTIAPGEQPPWPLRLAEVMRDDPGGSVDRVRARLDLEDTEENRQRVRAEMLRERLRAELLDDFTLTDRQLAERLSTPRADVFAVLAGVKKRVANELVGARFTEGRAPEWEDIGRGILGDAAERENADREDLLAAYRVQMGLARIAARSPAAPSGDTVHLQRSYDAEPPYFPFVDAARGFGAVNFRKDMDGTVRRIPLLIEHRGRLVKHLALAVACEILGIEDDDIQVTPDRTLRFSDSAGDEYVVPIDETGQAIINWAKDAARWRDGRDFPHISAGALWGLVDKKRAILRNERNINQAFVPIVHLIRESTFGVFQERVRELNDLEHQLHLARLEQRPASPELQAQRARRDELRAYVATEHQNAQSLIEMECADMRADLSPAELAADKEARPYLDAERIITEEIADYHAANTRLRAEIDELGAELRKRIEGKIVFFGYAATALGDIVATPIDPNTNGVMCHAHMLNTILQGKFIRQPPPALEFAVVFGLGALIAALTSTGGPRLTFVVMIAAVSSYALFAGYVLFGGQAIWIVFGAAANTIVVTWAMVTLFRQLTAERERRFFAKQLGQYTSPAIAARIAESPKAAEAFKSVQSREVTCLFTDLASFTTISEQEEPEIIQLVLNTYLERMSEVIWKRRGLINKFMGDGIMAFFNASVDPQDDHAQNAVAVTLDAFEALDELKREQAEGPAGAVFQRLHMRAGLATGVCKNGDFGSELKADYTVIGDTVNLAARLEPANKVFGTQVMISEDTMRRVADQYEFRYLAELRVKGKANTVPVHEVICRKGQLPAEQKAYIERFAAGVEIYKNRKWDECIVHFTRMLARRPDDPGVSRYIDACQELKTFPPDDDWNGALELKEK